jgi:ABC-type uncharacterized transport system ATPase subunit
MRNGADTDDGTDQRRVAVRMTGIGRRFGTTVALDAVDLELRRGEIHAVLGANGAGKTTLMRILAGLDRPDSGSVTVGNEQVHSFEPGRARAMGVALVQQHFTLVPTLTASANLELARPEGRLRPRRSDSRQRLADLVERYGLPVRDGVPASAMSVGEQQRLELLRALDANAEVLVLDEPTAVLTDAEADQLLEVCRRLADEGRAVAIITHRLGEVIAGCDRVTVLRDGSVVMADDDVADHNRAGLATAMIGSDATGRFEQRFRMDHDAAETAENAAGPDTAFDIGIDIGPAVGLEIARLSSGRLLEISLQVERGEVLGIAGIDGNGQAELEAVLAGRVAPDAGSVLVNARQVVGGDPQARRDAGVAYGPIPARAHSPDVAVRQLGAGAGPANPTVTAASPRRCCSLARRLVGAVGRTRGQNVEPVGRKCSEAGAGA